MFPLPTANSGIEQTSVTPWILNFFFVSPQVDAVSGFSKASGIPAFFVSFIVTPFASNASELVTSLQFAMKKKVSLSPACSLR